MSDTRHTSNRQIQLNTSHRSGILTRKKLWPRGELNKPFCFYLPAGADHCLTIPFLPGRAAGRVSRPFSFQL
jgi:hypothetical protein